MKKPALIFLCLLFCFNTFPWGFHGHKLINRTAVFALPPEMFVFYKRYIEFITDHSVDPDRRRYSDTSEACRHYIDLDYYESSLPIDTVPHNWYDAVKKYTEDTLTAHGIVPWHILLMKAKLTQAFYNKDINKILHISADIGHYIADAHVPLHTTHNYNGQFTGQNGIHAFWESRLPELYSNNYDLFTGKAIYIDSLNQLIWKTISESYSCLDSVLQFEKNLTAQFGDDKKYGFEEKGAQTVRVYSKEFSAAYSQLLDDQVERRMRTAAWIVSSVWYSAWFDAGQPVLEGLDLIELKGKNLSTFEEDINKLMIGRPEE